MEFLQDIQEFLNENLIQIIMSNPKTSEGPSKVKIRPVLVKGDLFFQETKYVGTQVFHKNFSKEEILSEIETELSEQFKQCEIKGTTAQATLLVSKKGKMTFKKKNLTGNAQDAKQPVDLSHNKEKQYILKEGAPVDFLMKLGVQTSEGVIHKHRYDKFRQINRYLEFIQDVLEELPKDRTIRIIDFGCGKSYLTFAMYFYLHKQQGRDIEVTGLDLKKDVIAHCNQIAEELGYDKLHFLQGDIKDYNGTDSVDLVVSLHACDTATDYAIAKAIGWNAKVIMAVPCCQHEVNKQIHCDSLDSVLQYGLIKERMSALLTDAMRAESLEQAGYDTQILEFIDMEHTPKNLLIRAVKGNKMRPAKKSQAESLEELQAFLGVQPTLQKLLKDK